MAERNGNQVRVFGSHDPDMKKHELLAKLTMEIKGLAESDSRLVSGAEEVLQIFSEMHTALLMPPQPTSVNHRVIPRFDIHIPMPSGAALPARSRQSQTEEIPPQEPVELAEAQSTRIVPPVVSPLPMPSGVAVPSQSPQKQTASIHQEESTEPAHPATAQSR